ncbi:NAD(P)-dependent oxidoreductase [Aeromicrobium chenweiae]|uniref:Hydroxyacid dehydrogenase n=1 Tax=Aeromicrobium chenweiae TaxID=2079793 RepID=A0A2S0WJF1_9ACTN|nr:NAD(P)-dependent oxidoreductase [Aeromicrobium chenweiae]AWB91466.1 hydroxyacid dehydrogenase [Aeromicrobium chenweiae]TGN29950.1 hydroxyacid dehydrogenase [Aeromicrobium chenweiae]
MASRTLHVTVPDAGWADRLADLHDVDLTVWDFASPQPDRHVDLAVRPYTVAAAGLESLDPSRLSVVQSQALGYDGVADTLPAGITYCNAVGVHEASTAELAVALLLASQREIDRYVREAGQWNRRFTASLIDRRILLLGHGGIGTELEKRLDGFDAELIRVATHRREDERGVIHGTDELESLLPTVDVVVLAVPLTEQTTHLVDDAFLSALPDGAIVVNVSRGKVADTDAIVRQGGRIRFAADVTDPEPLPADHPLWTVPGVLISPHVGGMSSAMQPRIDRIVRDQVQRLLDGRELEFVVVPG